MITIRQIRAARSLIDMSQAELADLSGLSVTSLSAIERGAKKSRSQNLQAIQSVLEAKGVEFTDGQGVRLAEEVFTINVFPKTEAGVADYHKKLLAALKATQGQFCSFSAYDVYKEENLRKIQFRYFQKMIQFGLTERIILPKKNPEAYGPKSVSQYRLLEDKYFGDLTIATFGHNFTLNLDKRITMIENKSVAEAFKKQFEFYWALAHPLPDTALRIYESDLKRWS